MLPNGIINPNIKLVYLQALEAQAKPHKLKCKVHGFYEAFASASL